MAALPSAKSETHRPDALAFYQEFYDNLAAGPTPERWFEEKQILADGIFEALLQPQAKALGRLPSILAVGAGLAIAEGIWKERGCDVVFNDCQETSLQAARKRFPDAGFLIGDIRAIPPNRQFDAISLLAFDYLFPRTELFELLQRASQWLTPGGQLIIYCPNALSCRQMGAEIVKRLLGRIRQKSYVHYGYWHSPGEFFRIAKKLGLAAQSWRFSSGPSGLRRESPPLDRWMSLRDNNLVVTMRTG